MYPKKITRNKPKILLDSYNSSQTSERGPHTDNYQSNINMPVNIANQPTTPPEKKTEPPLHFEELCSFVEQFEAPTGKIHHQTFLHLNNKLLQQNPIDVYDYRRLTHHFPNISDFLPKEGEHGYIIEAPVRIKQNYRNTPKEIILFTDYCW